MEQLYNTLTHVRRVRKWAHDNNAQLFLDLKSFVLTIVHSDRGITLLPRFLTPIDESTAAYTSLMPERGRFVGWLPYEMKRWDLASDKLAFKTYCQMNGLRVPRLWGADDVPTEDYIVKPQRGSFGRGIQGPFKKGASGRKVTSEAHLKEQFIRGKACKIWYWDSMPVAFIVVSPPTINADGVRTLAAIAREVRGSFDISYSLEKSEAFLRWQGLSAESVPPAGEKVLLDFLYGHAFDRMAMVDPDCLKSQSERLKAELLHIGQLLHAAIPVAARSGTLFTVDAVLDDEEQLWLLEMNSHTVLHPNAYKWMLDAWLNLQVFSI